LPKGKGTNRHWVHSSLGYPIMNNFSHMQKVLKLYFKDFLKLNFSLRKLDVLQFLLIMGFSFIDVKLFAHFKTIKWPNLVVLNLVANIFLKGFDLLVSFVLHIDPHILIVHYIRKYGLHTLYESKISRIHFLCFFFMYLKSIFCHVTFLDFYILVNKWTSLLS
jgi:hypothetical protein